MEPKFIQVGNVVFDLHKVSSVRFDEDSAVVFMSDGGFNHNFSGEDAQALRRFFAPQGGNDGEVSSGVQRPGKQGRGPQR